MGNDLLSPVSSMQKVHGDDPLGHVDQAVFESGLRREDENSRGRDERALRVRLWCQHVPTANEGQKWEKSNRHVFFSTAWRRMCLSLCAPWLTPPCLVLFMSLSHDTASWSAGAWKQARSSLACVLMILTKGTFGETQPTTHWNKLGKKTRM